jgi:predicted glycosyltransferase involved in capsule biosynthesis
MNTAIKYLIENENPEFICFFDADVFLSDNQYDQFLNIVNNLNDNDFFVAQKVLDISDDSVFLINFDEIKINLNEISYSIRKISSLGGFFLIKTSKLYEIGGFDERFVVWGGEDDDVSLRLIRTGMEKKFVEFDFYHLPHKKLSDGIKSNDDYKKQLIILHHDKTNIRPSSLNR